MYSSDAALSRTIASDGPWRHRIAAPVRASDRFTVAALVAFGAAGTFSFWEFWLRETHVGEPMLFFLLSLALAFGALRMLFGFFCDLGIARPSPVPARPGLRVAVFTTCAPGEPLAMFAPTLAALAKVRYPHTTYVLDGTADAAVRAVAERHGAVWLDMKGVEGAKAGKINRALELTDEEFILVLDPDHVAFPEFLDRVLGHFDDPRVAFVQVAQAYYNQERSRVARAAAEQTYGFYGPLQMGLNGHGAAIAIGANCTFRRAALNAIGGHAVGLAEDLLTSLRLHSAGFLSVYVPEVVSRGLVPEDLGGYLRQQLKWASGAVDMLLDELPKHYPSLTWPQRFAYFSIGTYYGLGVSMVFYALLPYAAWVARALPARVLLGEVVSAALPALAASAALYVYGQRWYCDPATERGVHWRGMLLKQLAWPVYLAGAVRSVAGKLVAYFPTRKQSGGEFSLTVLWPHSCLLALFASAATLSVTWRFTSVSLAELWADHDLFCITLAFAALPALATALALAWAGTSRTSTLDEAWTALSANEEHS